MKEVTKEKGYCEKYMVEFDSIYDFVEYISKTSFNCWFKDEDEQQSKTGSKRFTGTENYEEAMDLLKNGWDDMAKTLQQRLVAKEKQVVYGNKQKPTYDIAGYQACVPRYLQGIPTSMVNKKSVPIKQKVITISKSISYNWTITTEQIIEESVKAMQIIKKLEAQGLKVNLNVFFGAYTSDRRTLIIAKIKVKNANERLNVSKLAFPLVNPSMLRRLFFRFIEVYDKTPRDFIGNYGYPIKDYEVKDEMKEFDNKFSEYVFPAFVKKDINCIEDMSWFKV